MKTPLRIGTRGSALALAQAHEARARLMAAHAATEEDFEVVSFSTSGDRIQDRALSEAGGKGLFTKEIEDALADGRIDIAVHSSKDMPTSLPPGLEISAFLEREDVRDAFIGREVAHLGDLPHGATVGSSSLRRQALIRRLRPELEVVTYRGNLQTRLRKLREGVVDGTLLALAGLKRLQLQETATQLLPVETFPPALGQGAICIETRIGDTQMAAALAPINDARTSAELACERAFLAVLDGSCRTPIAGYTMIEGERLRFFGMVLTPDGREAHEIEEHGATAEAMAIGRRAGARLHERAGPQFFESWG